MSEPPAGRPSLWAVMRSFGLIGLTSMGGGRFVYFHHEFVTRRRWLSDASLLESLAIGQILPGPNVGNLAVLLGARLRQWWGAVLASISFLAPGGLMMFGLSAVYFGGGQIPAAGPVLRGVAAAAAGLAIANALLIGWRSVREPASVVLAALAVVLIVLGLPTLATVLLLGLIGTLLNRPRASDEQRAQSKGQ